MAMAPRALLPAARILEIKNAHASTPPGLDIKLKNAQGYSPLHELETSCPANRIDDELSNLLIWWPRTKCVGFVDNLLPLPQQAPL